MREDIPDPTPEQFREKGQGGPTIIKGIRILFPNFDVVAPLALIIEPVDPAD